MPLRVAVPLPNASETILLPGATRSTVSSLLLKLEIASPDVVEPTAVALNTHPGAAIAAVFPLLPLAAITDIFLPTAAFIADAYALSSASQLLE